MTLWLMLAAMTSVAVLAVLWPLGRRPREVAAGNDLAVYRDQIDEIDRDRAAGLIGAAEAEAARTEVSRRLLAAAEAAAQRKPDLGGGTARRRVAAVIALIALPAGAGGFYLMTGSPHLPGQPLAERVATPPEQRSLQSLVAQVEAHLDRNPEDGRGWEVLAPVYMRAGRFADAVKARRNALRLNGSSAARESDLGEALMAAANGVVTAEARASFERALAHDPRDFKARFFIGLAAEQDGRPEQAAALWRKLIAEAPAEAGWVDYVKQSLARLQQGPADNAPSPTAADLAAAGALSDEQRRDMARGMVDRLAERLKTDGSDLDGWERLVRSYSVLGEAEKARQAAADARRALGADPDKLRRLDQFLEQLGLKG